MPEAVTIDEDYVIGLLQRLVRTDSVNPHHAPRPPSEANEEKVAELVSVELAAAGIEHRKEYVQPYRPVVIGEIGCGLGSTLMLNAHMDTVGIEGVDNPLSGEIREGRLYGRGATDTKSSLAAMIAALRAVAADKIELKGKTIFTAVCDEEYAGIGTQHIATHGPRADAAIIGEPTKLDIGVGQVGGVKFKITVRGKAAHGNIPDAGVNAILKAAKLALRLPSVAKKRSHPLLGPPAFNIGTIAGGIEASTVPDYCELDCDRRILPGETLEQIFADNQELLDEMHREDVDFNASIESPYLGPVPGFELPPTEPIVVSVRRAYETALGEEARLVITPYAGDGMYLYRIGIPAITLGPGDLADAHFGEESVELSQVVCAAKVFAQTIIEYCGVKV